MSIVIATAGSGVIEGGWGFVWAAYGLTWATMVAYTISLFARARSAGEPT